MAKKSRERKLSRKEYDARLAVLRSELVQMQVELKNARVSTLIVIAGVEASGKGEIVNLLNAWLDPRGTNTFGFRSPTDEERERPPMWRYWRSLPYRGRIGIYAGGWHGDALRQEPRDAAGTREFDTTLRRLARFESELAADGSLIIKIWLHLSERAQAERMLDLESDARTAWRVSAEDWRSHRQYEYLARLSRRMRKATEVPGAPWEIISADRERQRNLAVAEHILARFRAYHRVNRRPTVAVRPETIRPLAPAGRRRLTALPLDQELTSEEYEEKRDKWLGRLHRAFREASLARRPVILVFEGWDAAGKGGAIRRLSEAIDARDCRVIPVSKPTDEEKAHHYLWRFWRHVPRAGLVTIYDRSWYGRVLVERIEGFARSNEWRRAYAEINEFERELVENGAILLKFWLQVSKTEQLRRFRDRETTDYKRHKMDLEDWRNRRKWEAYEVCVGDMLALTETRLAPWHLIPAENKRYARLEIIRTTCREIRAALGE
ncbi:MAG TPA: polyphosphate:AMP phosphotransferase [Opitutaceae bacterium]